MHDDKDSVVRQASLNEWMQLFEATLLEREPIARARRLQLAKDAVMDRIEGLSGNTSDGERQLLLATLRTILQLEQSIMPSRFQNHEFGPTLGQPA